MYVQEKLAYHDLRPVKPPLPWAGRSDIIEDARQHFGGSYSDAAQLVDLAVLHLWDKERDGGGDASPVKLDLLLLRLKDLRKIARRALTEVRKETTYVYDKNPNNENQLIERMAKEKRYTGVDLAALGKLMELEGMIAQLQSLGVKKAGGGSFDAIAAIFAQMDERMSARDGSADGRPSIGSKAQQLLAGKVDGSNKAGLAVLQAAWIETQGQGGSEKPPTGRRRAKRVDSKQSDADGG